MRIALSRSSVVASQVTYGKQREPLLRVTAAARALETLMPIDVLGLKEFNRQPDRNVQAERRRRLAFAELQHAARRRIAYPLAGLG